MRKGTERIPGFQEDIHPGVWQRHTIMGAPKKWTEVWIGVCLFGLAYIIYALPFQLVLPLGGVWLVGQSVLVALTKWDPQWDDVLLAPLGGRRYKQRYGAG